MMAEMNDFINENYRPLCRNEMSERVYLEKDARQRNSFQRDYSRILYSSSFRRLQGKMQLLGVQHDKFYRNRLTHSLEVSQIARGIVERLRKLSNMDIYKEDIYVVESAALAHDIGNAPFGHHGERILNEIMKNNGGFEGNAQTLRVLTHLEKKLPSRKGLNLTKRTLLSVVKYFNKNDKKKFIYNDDYEFIKSICESYDIKVRTIDVQIMDLADEIAYGAHDLEDALSLNLFTIDEFLYEFKIEEKTSDTAYEKLNELVLNAKEVASEAKIYKSSEEYAFLFRKELISHIVHELINDISVVKVSEEDKLKTGTMNQYELGFKNYNDLAEGLKDLTFKCINRSDIVQIYEKQGEKIIKGLFEAFMDESFNKDNKLLPVEFRCEDRTRGITDFIAGMMDSYAIKVYEDIYGRSAVNEIYNIDYFDEYDYTKFRMKESDE